MKSALKKSLTVLLFLLIQPLSATEELSPSKEKKSVIIVGGGSIGLFTAKYAHDLGMNVTVIEKNRIAEGASYGNAGHIVPSLGTPSADPAKLLQHIKELSKKNNTIKLKPKYDLPYLKWLYHHLMSSNQDKFQKSSDLLLALGSESRKLYDDLENEYAYKILYQQGRLKVYRAKGLFLEGRKSAKILLKKNVETIVFSKEELQKNHSFLNISKISGGIFHPNDAHIPTYHFLIKLAENLRSKGVDIKENTNVIGFIKQEEQIISLETTEGIFSADEIVIAAGNATPELALKLGISNILMQSGAGYSITIPHMFPTLNTTVMIEDDHITLSPFENDLRIASAIILGDENPEIDLDIVQTILKNVSPYLLMDINSVPREKMKIWKGFRPCTPDDMPYIGRHSKYNNLIFASGHGTIGIHLGPVTGKLVSQLLSHEEPSINIDSLSPERF